MLNVTTPASSYALIARDDAKTALSITGSAEDTMIDGMIARASDVIARHCRRVFALETVEQRIRIGQQIGELLLDRYPVTAVASITEDGSALSETDYEINPSNGVVSRLANDRPCWWRAGKIVVSYSAGFALADMPAALQQACLQLVKAYYIGADRDPLVRSESVTPISSASYFSGDDAHLPPEVRDLLTPFRKIR